MPKGYRLGKGTVIRFQGTDRRRVFNNLCTQDLRTLADGQALETFITDVKGRTFGHGIAMSVKGEAFFISVPGQAAKLVPHFDRYIIREDAVLSDVSSDYQFWLFQDPRTVARAFDISTEAIPIASSAKVLELDGQRIFFVNAPWIGLDSILGLIPSRFNDQSIIDRLGSNWLRSDMEQRTGWELAVAEKVLKDASPQLHVGPDKSIPPFLICYSRGMGAQPQAMRSSAANAFKEALSKAGISAEVVDASDRNHGEINLWFGKAEDKKVTGKAKAFLEKLAP